MQSSRRQRFENIGGFASLARRLPRGRPARRGAILAGVVAALALTAAPALAATGDLAQKPGQAGCVRQSAVFGGGVPNPLCADGRALLNTTDVVVSPDGKNAYVTGQGFGGVAIFDRDPATGTLTQKPGFQGCVSERGDGGEFGVPACQDGKALSTANSVAVSPDGKSVYVASYQGVAIFDRDTTTGALTQKADPAGCISETGQSNRDDSATAGECEDGTGVSYPTSVTVSPDGKNAYVASHAPSYSGLSSQGSLAILDRNPTTGALTQRAGPSGCISETGRSDPDDAGTAGQCQDGKALDGVFTAQVSPDGKNVYAVSEPADAVAIFDRDATGALTQKAATAGCVSDDGTAGACADGKALDLTNETYDGEYSPNAPHAVTVSPDGKSVYVAAHGSDAVAIFDRDAAGALAQKAGTAGCVSEDGTGGACADGNALDRVNGVVVSPDGQSLYAVSYEHTSNTPEQVEGRNGSAIVIFDRDLATGGLAQKAGTAGCIQDDDYRSAENPDACTKGRGLAGAISPTLSPNGKNLYVAAYSNNALTTFDRELPPDADNDGVFDAADRCPTQAGPASNQGCPIPGAGSTGGGGNPPGGGGNPPGGGGSIPPKATVCRSSAGVRVIGKTKSGGRVFEGTKGNDRICGTSAGDVINGRGGKDLISGGGGNDRINGGSGNDRISGGSGNDRISGGSGNDRISGGSGKDRISGGSGKDRISGGSGNDSILGGSGNDRISGNSGRDRINGNSGSDSVGGGSGADAISARDRRRDRVSCGSGRDKVSADRVDRVARTCERVKRR